MRLAIGLTATIVAGVAIVWAGVDVQGQLARGEDLRPLPFVVAGIALALIVLVALLSDSMVRGRRRRRSRPRASNEYRYTRTDDEHD